MGHVNNTVYFRYMEQARISWFETHRRALARSKGQGPVIVNASCTFLKQLVYPGDVEVRTLRRRDRAQQRRRLIYELRPSYDPEELYAEGAAKVVWIDLRRPDKSVPLPDAIRATHRTLKRCQIRQTAVGTAARRASPAPT